MRAYGISFSIQFEGRGNGAKRHLDGLGANLAVSGQKAAESHMVGEGAQYVIARFSCLELQIWVYVRKIEIDPSLVSCPKTDPLVVSCLHDSSLN